MRKSGRIQHAIWASGGSGLASWQVFERSRRAAPPGGCRVAAARGDRYSTARAAQAAKCSPASRTRPLGGGCGSNPRWLRIFSITGRSRMAAMILSSPAPQFGQRCMSMSNTRLSSRAQLMRASRAWGRRLAGCTGRWCCAQGQCGSGRPCGAETPARVGWVETWWSPRGYLWKYRCFHQKPSLSGAIGAWTRP